MTRSVKVSIAGHQFSVRTDASPKYIKDLAAYVTDKIDEAKASGRTVTTQSLALLAAMSIADELHQLQHSQERLKRQIREKSKKILHYLDTKAEL